MARRISDEFRQELLDKTDIVDVVSRYVSLKKKGGKYWGCCPFHKEKTPSFNVDIAKQFFYCFGCGKGGDAITFVKEIEHMNYPEAVELLADRAGLSIPEDESFDNDREWANKRKRHYEICKEAAKYFFAQLKEKDNPAQHYCEKRGLTPAVVKRFGIGFAPKSGGLVEHLVSKGFTVDEMVASGLAKKGTGGKINEFFFDRLMFPIMDLYGNVIAFGGRVLGDGTPKYLNSADSPLYNKKKHLYGLNIAKKQKATNRLILVEGYMDVVSVNSFGISGAVASLGTSFTNEQCRLIKRFTNSVYIAYDGDSAGKNAAIRASKILAEEGIVPRILVLKEGLDPDEFLKKYGEEKFEKLIEQAVLPYRFEIDFLLEQHDISNESERRNFTTEAIEVIARAKSELDREDMIKYLSARTGYSVETIQKQLYVFLKGVKKQEPQFEEEAPRKQVKDSLKTKAEALAIKIALNGFRDEILLRLGEDDFETGAYKECFAAIKDGLDDEVKAVALFDDEDKHKRIMKAIIIPDSEVSEESLENCISTIKHEKMKSELEKCKKQLLDPNISKEERKELLEKISELQKQIKTD